MCSESVSLRLHKKRPSKRLLQQHGDKDAMGNLMGSQSLHEPKILLHGEAWMEPVCERQRLGR